MEACKEKEEGREEGRTGAGAVKREGRSGTEGKVGAEWGTGLPMSG